MSSRIEENARIEEIRLRNFRAFEDARLPLADLTFLVGRNGAGKSSLLDAIEFMREALTDSLPNALNRRDGFDAVFRKGAPAEAPMGLAIVMRVPLAGRTVRLLYGFEIVAESGGFHLREALKVSAGQAFGFVRSGDDANSLEPRGPMPSLIRDKIHEAPEHRFALTLN